MTKSAHAQDESGVQSRPKHAGRPAFREIEFTSDGAQLRGRLYLPDAQPSAIVVMGHGFSATIPMVMDRFAECFRDHGIAALAFDHRGHGTSDGLPRGEINYWVQARGYLDAITVARSIDNLRELPVAVWGDSLSGRVALGVTALDDRVSALVAQVPAFGDELGSDDPEAEQLEVLRNYLNAGDFRKPEESWTTASVVSPDQVSLPSALEPLTAFRWFIEYGGRFGTDWTNRVTFTTPKDAPLFDPAVFAPHVSVPTQFVVARNDEMQGASSDVAHSVAERITGDAEVLDVNGGHFGLLEYPSELFAEASVAQAEFLIRALN